MATELGHDNQTGVGHVVLVLPTFYVAEAGELLAVKGDDGLALLHFGSDVLVRTAGNAGAAHLGSVGNGLEYSVNVFLMTCISYDNADSIVVFFHTKGVI